MEQFINSAIVQIVLAAITLIEFTIAIVSYQKISKVRKSQIEYRDIVELDKVLSNLKNNTKLLSAIKADEEVSLPPQLSERIEKTVAINHECIGAVNKANQILLNSEKAENNGDVIYHERGYFNNDFYKEIILKAQKRIVFYIKRNTRPFTLDNLSALTKLADEQNVKISLFAFSPQMDEEVMKEMMKSIPNSPDGVEELKRSQIASREFYVGCKKQMRKPQNITYYEYRSFPLSQYIIVDNTLYWGIVNYNKTGMINAFEERPYLEMDVSNPFAQYIISLQNTSIAEANNNGEVF